MPLDRYGDFFRVSHCSRQHRVIRGRWRPYDRRDLDLSQRLRWKLNSELRDQEH